MKSRSSSCSGFSQQDGRYPATHGRKVRGRFSTRTQPRAFPKPGARLTAYEVRSASWTKKPVPTFVNRYLLDFPELLINFSKSVFCRTKRLRPL
jgi:hypothetical protein